MYVLTLSPETGLEWIWLEELSSTISNISRRWENNDSHRRHRDKGQVGHCLWPFKLDSTINPTNNRTVVISHIPVVNDPSWATRHIHQYFVAAPVLYIAISDSHTHTHTNVPSVRHRWQFGARYPAQDYGDEELILWFADDLLCLLSPSVIRTGI